MLLFFRVYSILHLQYIPRMFTPYCSREAWRNLENNALSSLHKLLRNRLAGEGVGSTPHPPPPVPLNTHSLAGSVKINAKTTVHCSPEPEFVNHLRSRGIESQPGGPVRQPYLTYRPARLQRLAESIPWNQFLGSLNVYKFGLWFLHAT
jgi:hypothetical protein